MTASNGPAGPTGPPGSAEPAPAIEAPAQLRAGAGGSVTGQVRVTNTASEARVMSLSMHGVDASWLPAASRSRALAPGESIAADITLRPAVGTIAARYPVAIAVQALDPSTGQATSPTALAEVVLVVDAPGEVGITLDPTEARAVFGKRIKVRLRNDGGRPATVDLQAQTPLSARLHLARPQVQVPAGQTVTVAARVRPRRVRLFGGPVRQAFTVTSRSMGAPRHAEGILTSRAMLGSTATKVVALLTIVGLWAGLAVVFIPKLADHLKSGTGTVVAGAGSTAAAAATPGPGKGSGSGSGGSGGTRSGGSTSGAKSGNKAKPASAANSVQLNGTVAGTSPSGVTVSLAPTSLVDEAAEAAIPVGLSAQAVDSMRLTGKIPQSALTASSARTSGQHRTVTTSADGAWSFPAVPKPGYYLLTFAKSGYQSVSYVVDSTTASPTKPLNVVMSAGQGQLNGMVTGPGGKRVGGATITITDGTNTITTSTDSTGNVGAWSVVGLSTPSTYLVSATLAGMSTGSRLVPLGAGGAATVNLKLVAGVGAITGTVSALDGSGGLGGVSVSATDGDAITRTATTVTGGTLRGRYTLSGLTAPGKYTITFTAQGYLIQTVQVTLGKGQASATQNVTLFPSTATVEGIANNASGPLAGAGLILNSSDNTYKTTSGDDGSYRFDGVAPGSYVLSAQYSGLTTVFKSLTVTAGASAPIAVPGFTLTQPPAQTSTATITGFVSDGNNPSNTLCPSTPGHCTVTFTLHDQSGAVVPLVQSSIAAATGGPTSYTLQPASGVSPGLYKLTIGATGYLPTTVTVQLPLSGTATAPAISLYPVNTVNGTITTVGNLASGPVGTGYPTSYTNCVYLVPTGGAAPNTAATCDSSQVTASTCTTTGTAGPAYTVITGDSFGFGNLCDGSYDVYVSIANPWYVAPAPTTITLAHGQTLAVTIAVTRLGQLVVTMRTVNTDGTYSAVPSTTPVALSCPTKPSGAATPTPASITPSTSGGITTKYTIGGFAAGSWDCTFTPSGGTAVDTGTMTMSNNNAVTQSLSFTAIVGALIGQVTTSWSGNPVGVGGATVTVSGITGFDSNGNSVTDDVTVTADSDGCFAVTPTGSAPTPPTTGGCSSDDFSTSGSVKKLALVVARATLHVGSPSGYLTTSDLVNQQFSSGTPLSISLNPQPVNLTGGLTLTTDPAPSSTVPLPSGISLQVTSTPPGAGQVTASYTAGSTSGGAAITLKDSNIGTGNKISPGNYTIAASKNGYKDSSVSFLCNAGGNCNPSQTLTLTQLGSLVVKVTSDGSASVNGAYVGLTDPPTQSTGATNNIATFTNLTPGGSYSVYVQAAGYQFGAPTLSCTVDGSTSAAISIKAGLQTTCIATLTAGASIIGTVYGVLAKSGTTPNQKLSGITVTASDGSVGFTGVTLSDGTYRITGSNTTELTPGSNWTVTVASGDAPGYATPVTSATFTVSTATASTAPDLDLYVTPVTLAVTLQDQDGAAVPGLSVSLVSNSSSGPTYTSPTDSGGTYTFGSTSDPTVIPGSYTLKFSGTGYVSGTAQVTVAYDTNSATANQQTTVTISQAATQVSGTVSGIQGSDSIASPLQSATACIVNDSAATACGTKSAPNAAVVKGTDGNKLVVDATGSNGAFNFSTVPNSGSQTFYLRVERYGYTSYVGPGFTVTYGTTAPSLNFPVSLDRVTQTVKITVTASDASDDLSTSAAAALTTASGSGSAPLNVPTNAPLTNLSIAPDTSDTSTFTVTQTGVPYGCWTFTFTAPTNHYGTLSAPDNDGSGGLTCATGSFQVPGTGAGTSEVDVSYTFTEYQPLIDVTFNNLANDTAPSSLSAAVKLTNSADSSVVYLDDSTATITSGSNALDVWIDAVATLDVTPALTQWQAVTGTSIPSSASVPITVKEVGGSVTITVKDKDGNSLKNTALTNVTLTPSASATGITAMTVTGADAKTDANGQVTITGVPVATDWTATATRSTTTTPPSTTTTPESATFDVTLSSTATTAVQFSS